MKDKKKLRATVSLKLEEPDKQNFEMICSKLKSTKSEIARDLVKNFIHKLN